MVHGVALSVVSALYDVIASVVTRVKNVILPLQISHVANLDVSKYSDIFGD